MDGRVECEGDDPGGQRTARPSAGDDESGLPPSLAEAVATGRLRPAAVPGAMPRPRGAVSFDTDAGMLLREMRDEERY